MKECQERNEESLERQVALVKAFAEENLLGPSVRLCSSLEAKTSLLPHVWLRDQ